MDYSRNEDRIRVGECVGANYNNIEDILFVEDSSPVTEPATYEEALVQCNIDDIANDRSLIESYITTARMQCEGFTGIGFVHRTVQAVIRNQIGGIYLPYGPVVDLISATDREGVAFDCVLLGVQWKTVRTIFNFGTLTYTAGYSVLPTVLKTALLQQVAYLYEHRGDEKDDKFSPVAKSLLQPFRRV